jgi:hypothetical protein
MADPDEVAAQGGEEEKSAVVDQRPAESARDLQESERALRRTKRAVCVLVPVQVVFWIYFWATSARSGLSAPMVLVSCVPPTVVTIYAVATVMVIKDRLWTTVVIVFAAVDILITFSKLYYDAGTTRDFTEPLSHTGALYFSLGMLTTAGTGTISPVSDAAKTVVGIQMILDLLFFAVALVIAVTRFTEPTASTARRDDAR